MGSMRLSRNPVPGNIQAVEHLTFGFRLMTFPQLPRPPRRRKLPSRRFQLFTISILMFAGSVVRAATESADSDKGEAAEEDDVISLAAYNVKADRI